MAAESAADRAVFVDTDDFGVAATIGASTVNGIFDSGYQDAEDIEGTDPRFECVTADLPSITLGTTTCTIDGTAYVIRSQQDDGTGMTILELSAP